ncbi:MAG: isoprenylcysteine carboxylmethyltransferase family protein [Acidobacteriota bacterium]
MKQKIENFFIANRISSGFVIVLIIILISKPTLTSLLMGAIIGILGLLIRAWSSGHLIKDKSLTTSGPYRFTRHPLYFGNLLLGIGFIISSNSFYGLILFIIYFLLFYIPIIKLEEKKMDNFFSDKFGEYKDKVPVIFPIFKPYKNSSNKKFSWFLYFKNREWRASIGFITIWLILIIKSYL